MRKLDIPGTIQQLVAFIRQTMTEAGFRRLVVAVSGGIDSATAAALAVSALGPEHVFAILLPYLDWHEDARQRTSSLLSRLRIPTSNVQEINIAPMVDAFRESLLFEHPAGQIEVESREVEHIRLGNIMARVRMVALFDQAKKLQALVLGTENKSEHYLGYYTRFGDEASDLEPLRTLYKTEVYQIAGQLSIPEAILTAVPTAGLWPGQTDEGQFGFTYQQADEILYGMYDCGMNPEQLVAQGLGPVVVNEVKTWVEQVDFKHHLPKLAPEPMKLGDKLK